MFPKIRKLVAPKEKVINDDEQMEELVDLLQQQGHNLLVYDENPRLLKKRILVLIRQDEDEKKASSKTIDTLIEYGLNVRNTHKILMTYEDPKKHPHIYKLTINSRSTFESKLQTLRNKASIIQNEEKKPGRNMFGRTET